MRNISPPNSIDEAIANIKECCAKEDITEQEIRNIANNLYFLVAENANDTVHGLLLELPGKIPANTLLIYMLTSMPEINPEQKKQLITWICKYLHRDDAREILSSLGPSSIQITQDLNFPEISEALRIKFLINSRNADGLTALHIAVSQRNLPAITKLLAQGALLNMIDGGGNTALHRATHSLQGTVVTELLAANADCLESYSYKQALEVALELRLELQKEALAGINNANLDKINFIISTIVKHMQQQNLMCPKDIALLEAFNFNDSAVTELVSNQDFSLQDTAERVKATLEESTNTTSNPSFMQSLVNKIPGLNFKGTTEPKSPDKENTVTKSPKQKKS